MYFRRVKVRKEKEHKCVHQKIHSISVSQHKCGTKKRNRVVILWQDDWFKPTHFEIQISFSNSLLYGSSVAYYVTVCNVQETPRNSESCERNYRLIRINFIERLFSCAFLERDYAYILICELHNNSDPNYRVTNFLRRLFDFDLRGVYRIPFNSLLCHYCTVK